MMNNVQGDCRCGSLGFPAGEDLTLATGKLSKLNADGHVVLPTANTDITPYVITCGADQGYLCGVTPLNSLSNSRVILKGTCQAGQLLVAVGDGRVETGALSGTAVPVGIAEEDGVEGQHVLLRPLSVGAKGADGADGAPGTAGTAGAAGPAGADGLAGGVFYLEYTAITNNKPATPAACLGILVDYYFPYTWDTAAGGLFSAVVVGWAPGPGVNDSAVLALVPWRSSTLPQVTEPFVTIPKSCINGSGSMTWGGMVYEQADAGGFMRLGYMDSAELTCDYGYAYAVTQTHVLVSTRAHYDYIGM